MKSPLLVGTKWTCLRQAGFALLFYVIKHFVGLRMSREEELRGLDIDEHGMEAYSLFSIFITE